MKVIVCKPSEKPQVVELPKKHSYKDILKLLEIETPLECVSRKIGDTYYDFWIDEEGLLKETKYVSGVCANAEEILCGNIVIATNDGVGNTTGLTDRDIKNIMTKTNVLSNEEFLSYKETPKYPRNTDGDVLVIGNYHGFGTILLKPKGFMLCYEV